MDYQKQIDAILSTANYGDLIEFVYPIGYSHWAVYDGDGYVIHFAVAEESHLMSHLRSYIQDFIPSSGDLLLGKTKIRRMKLGEVNVPKGARVLINNNRHACQPSSTEDIKKRYDALLDKEFGYRLFTFNCEHFATFLRYGQAVCNQIPGRQKDKECEETTREFQDIVNKLRKSDTQCLLN